METFDFPLVPFPVVHSPAGAGRCKRVLSGDMKIWYFVAVSLLWPSNLLFSIFYCNNPLLAPGLTLSFIDTGQNSSGHWIVHLNHTRVLRTNMFAERQNFFHVFTVEYFPARSMCVRQWKALKKLEFFCLEVEVAARKFATNVVPFVNLNIWWVSRSDTAHGDAGLRATPAF